MVKKSKEIISGMFVSKSFKAMDTDVKNIVAAGTKIYGEHYNDFHNKKRVLGTKLFTWTTNGISKSILSFFEMLEGEGDNVYIVRKNGQIDSAYYMFGCVKLALDVFDGEIFIEVFIKNKTLNDLCMNLIDGINGHSDMSRELCDIFIKYVDKRLLDGMCDEIKSGYLERDEDERDWFIKSFVLGCSDRCIDILEDIFLRACDAENKKIEFSTFYDLK